MNHATPAARAALIGAALLAGLLGLVLAAPALPDTGGPGLLGGALVVLGGVLKILGGAALAGFFVVGIAALLALASSMLR